MNVRLRAEPRHRDADFAIATSFMYRDVAGISLACTPHVAGWIERVKARPFWQAAEAPIRDFIAG